MITLPAPLPLVTILHIVTLTLHLLAMNLLVGALFFLALLRPKGDTPSSASLSYVVPTLLTATVSLGVAPLLFAQLVYRHQVYAASIVSAWWWLGTVAAAIGIYLCAYGTRRQGHATPRWSLLLPALLLAIYVSVVFSGVFHAAEHPDLIASTYAANQAGTAFPPALWSWALRWLHMFTGALAVGGLFVAWWTRNDEAAAPRGRQFFLASMGAALVAGFAYLLSLGELVLAIMRSHVVWELTFSVLLALGGTHFAIQRRFGIAGAMIGVSTLGMVAIRHAVRDFRLAGTFDPGALPVQAQWGAFSLFLVCLVAAVAMMSFLVRAFRESAPDKS
ncbi:hypothetical protein K8I85_05735 [bacterium]|nr:hypothetical protein [bacterium]